MQWLGSNHVGTPTDTNATMTQQQRDGVFCAIRTEILQAGRDNEESVDFFSELVSELENCCSSVLVSCCEKLVAEVGDSYENQRKGNIRRSKPLPSNDGEDVTVNTSGCVCVCGCNNEM
jgi:hypothetical protein